MEISTLYTVICLLISSAVISAQTFNIGDSLNSFGINLLKETTDEAGDSVNVALSPYTVWSLMSLISEGAKENTLKQLDKALLLPSDKEVLRKSFQNLTKLLKGNSNGVELDYNMALFHNNNFPVKKSFEEISKNVYDVAVKPVDFANTQNAEMLINKYVADTTRQRITKFISEDDVRNAQVFLTSVLFFKGEWSSRFSKTATQNDTFYDEKRNKLGYVDMMFQLGVFPFVRLEEISAFALELPYGTDKKMSMVLILPFKGETLSEVLNRLSQRPFSFVIDALAKSEQEYADDSIYVYVPKFKIASDFNLNIVLSRMGIKDVFELETANLLGMFDHYLYLNRLIQRAEIEVDEEGTVASSAAGGGFIDKIGPLKIKFDKPFLYFIVDKPTKSILFAGKLSNPNTI